MFYFRAFVPRSLHCKMGLTQLKISLKTPYLGKARSHARHLSARVEHVFDALKKGAWDNMDTESIKKLALKYLQEVIETDERQRTRSGPRSTAEAVRMSEIMGDNIADDLEALATNDYSRIWEDAISIIADLDTRYA